MGVDPYRVVKSVPSPGRMSGKCPGDTGTQTDFLSAIINYLKAGRVTRGLWGTRRHAAIGDHPCQYALEFGHV